MRTGQTPFLVPRWLRTPLLVVVMAGLAGGMGGCEADSFFNPAVVGYWKSTPTIMPILDRLSAIEDEPAEFVQTSPVLPGDLLPEADTYRLASGDVVEIRIRDFYIIGAEEIFERQVDQRGNIELPRLAPIRAQGRTTAEFITGVENAIRVAQISERPVVAINLKTQRKQTYAVSGAVNSPGTYFIPSPDFRLLEGLGSAGAINENVPFIYVVRQVPLTRAASGDVPESEPTKRRQPGRPPSEGARPGLDTAPPEDLNKVIDEIIKRPEAEQPKAPGMLDLDSPAAPTRAPQPEPPPIDLPDASKSSAPFQSPQAGGWVYADGKWVKVRPGPDGQQVVTEQALVTQRVIKIPTGPLLAGAADVNIVLRPGDVIRVPVPKGGLVYVTGEVQRPGPYNIPSDGKLTILRAIDAAGGLNNLAIPEKVDITRMVGHDRQATMRLDLRAIAKQAQPDLYIKPDDRINVGTNFWAQPLAIIRSGFRASYGFGFILDRNFQGDVFGVDRATGNQGF